MIITSDFLEKSILLYNIKNYDRLYKKLTWVVNFDNGCYITNKISDDTKISNVIFQNYRLEIFGSIKSDGINDNCKILYYVCDDNSKKIEKTLILNVFAPILNSIDYYYYCWYPTVNFQKKLYIEFYE